MAYEYRKEKNQDYNYWIEQLLKDMPDYVRTYERGIEGSTAPYTRFLYLQRISIFFSFLCEANPEIKKKGIRDISLDDLDALTAEDIEEFTHFIRTGRGAGHENKEVSVNHYLSALSSFFEYCVTHDKLKKNIIKAVKRAKKVRHEVVRLNDDEKAEFFDSVVNGSGLSKRQQQLRSNAVVARDYAICILLIRTGLRVSEAVGINLGDLDIKRCCVHVMRKESKPDTVYFSDEVKEALSYYLSLRGAFCITPVSSETDPLFLASTKKDKGKRLSVRSVERLVKKYAESGIPSVGSRITPHKLRSTYATDMIRKTGNLSLVQAELNHESPATTALYIDQRAQELEKHRNDLD